MAEALSFEVVVNGQPTTVQVDASALVRDIVEPALAATFSRAESEWEVRLRDGGALYLDQMIRPFVGQRLWINLRAGYAAARPLAPSGTSCPTCGLSRDGNDFCSDYFHSNHPTEQSPDAQGRFILDWRGITEARAIKAEAAHAALRARLEKLADKWRDPEYWNTDGARMDSVDCAADLIAALREEQETTT